VVGEQVTVIFVDTETTGLDPTQHEVWEIALIEEDGTEYEWRIRPQRLDRAEPGALRVNRLYEREMAARAVNPTKSFWTVESGNLDGYVAGKVAALTANKHLVGVVPDFDARFLEVFLRQRGLAPAWHYQTIDAEVLAAGRLGLSPPYRGEDIDRALGLDPPPPEDKHTALGDARWAMRMYVNTQHSGPDV
jgi:DNA polymerase III epsilon subunit-like protein